MKSMTGYGRARQVLHGRTVTVELRAVNHRYLDCTVKAPRQFGFLDDAVKKAAAARIARGKTEIYVSVETDEGGDLSVTVNHALAERYLAALRELSEKYGLRDDVTVMSLAKLPDVLGSERIEQDADELTQDVRAGYTGVIAVLRCGEGPTLALRFDIDALPMAECPQETHRPTREGFASVNPDMMHA